MGKGPLFQEKGLSKKHALHTANSRKPYAEANFRNYTYGTNGPVSIPLKLQSLRFEFALVKKFNW